MQRLSRLEIDGDTGSKGEPLSGKSKFCHEGYTLGAEIEYQLIDANSLDLTPLAPIILASVPPALKPNVTGELFQSTLEIRSAVCDGVQSLENDLRRACQDASKLTAEKNCMLYAASLHPFAKAEEQLLTDKVIFRESMNELQLVGRQFITQGLHVHVGLPDRAVAIRVCNAIQAYLPLLLAASASSPFFQGIDTGFMSYRTKLYEMMPASGIYGYQPDWRHYRSEASHLKEMGLIDAVSDLLWDTRLNLQFGTLEIRICDVPCRFSHILALAACVQALVAALVEHGEDFGPLSHTLMQANKWQAARHGLQGQYMDPAGILISKKMNISKALRYLIKELQPISVRLGSWKYLDIFEQILTEGTGADQQLEVFKRTNDLQEVVRLMHRDFWT